MALAALLLGTLGGCSDDEPDPDSGEGTLEQDANAADMTPDGSTQSMDASSPGPTADAGDADVVPDRIDCELGVPDVDTGMAFAPLVEAGEVPLKGTGQTGQRMVFAVRTWGLGDELEFTFVVTRVEPPDADAGGDDDVDGGTGRPLVDGETTVIWRTRSASAECGDDGWCTWVPVVLASGDLAHPEELDCLEIDVEMHVDDGQLTCDTSLRGVLARETCSP